MVYTWTATPKGFGKGGISTKRLYDGPSEYQIRIDQMYRDIASAKSDQEIFNIIFDCTVIEYERMLELCEQYIPHIFKSYDLMFNLIANCESTHTEMLKLCRLFMPKWKW
jgi:hypothetical protein